MESGESKTAKSKPKQSPRNALSNTNHLPASQPTQLSKTTSENYDTKDSSRVDAQHVGTKNENGATVKPSAYGQGVTAIQAFAIVTRLSGVFSGKKLTFVITAPKENERFRQEFYAMVVQACHASTRTDCMIEPVPDPDVELDTGIPVAEYSGIVIHASDSHPELIETMLKNALDQCFIIHKNTKIPDGVSKLNPRPDSQLVWFELGPGSPWNPAGSCQAN